MTQPSTPLALDLEFDPQPDGSAHVRWEASEIGAPEDTTLTPPYAGSDLELMLRALDWRQSTMNHPGFSGTQLARLQTLGLAESRVAPGRLLHQVVGRALYEALAAGEGASRLAVIRSHITSADRPLALRLHFRPDAVELAALPWELLWGPGDQQPLLMRVSGSSCTRHLPPVDAVSPSRGGSKPLRVLPVVAHYGLSDDYRAAERASRAGALGRISQAEVVQLREVSPATMGALSLSLEDNPPDIVHIVAHGAYMEGQCCLWLDREGAPGEPLRVPMLQLLPLLAQVRMVVLSVCQSGALVEQEGRAGPLLSGAAQALSAAGVPMVLAMQLTVQAEAAYSLLETFYRNLARERSVQEALARARADAWTRSMETDWYVPVLYLNAKDLGPAYLIGGPKSAAEPATLRCQRVTASHGSTVEGVEQEQEGPADQCVDASDQSTVKNVRQRAGGA